MLTATNMTAGGVAVTDGLSLEGLLDLFRDLLSKFVDLAKSGMVSESVTAEDSRLAIIGSFYRGRIHEAHRNRGTQYRVDAPLSHNLFVEERLTSAPVTTNAHFIEEQKSYERYRELWNELVRQKRGTAVGDSYGAVWNARVAEARRKLRKASA